jgi:hypothetical protein
MVIGSWELVKRAPLTHYLLPLEMKFNYLIVIEPYLKFCLPNSLKSLLSHYIYTYNEGK